jgi:hypothetical protein
VRGPQRLLVLARSVSVLGDFAAPVALSFAVLALAPGPRAASRLALVLAATAGPGWALAANAASYGVAAALLGPLRAAADPAQQPAGGRPGSLRQLREGWHTIAHSAWLWPPMLYGLLFVLLVDAPYEVIGPLLSASTTAAPPPWRSAPPRSAPARSPAAVSPGGCAPGGRCWHSPTAPLIATPRRGYGHGRRPAVAGPVHHRAHHRHGRPRPADRRPDRAGVNRGAHTARAGQSAGR